MELFPLPYGVITSILVGIVDWWDIDTQPLHIDELPPITHPASIHVILEHSTYILDNHSSFHDHDINQQIIKQRRKRTYNTIIHKLSHFNLRFMRFFVSTCQQSSRRIVNKSYQSHVLVILYHMICSCHNDTIKGQWTTIIHSSPIHYSIESSHSS